MEVILANKEIVFGLLLALSEVLALIPSVKSNSIFQLAIQGIKAIKDLFKNNENHRCNHGGH